MGGEEVGRNTVGQGQLRRKSVGKHQRHIQLAGQGPGHIQIGDHPQPDQHGAEHAPHFGLGRQGTFEVPGAKLAVGNEHVPEQGAGGLGIRREGLFSHGRDSADGRPASLLLGLAAAQGP